MSQSFPDNPPPAETGSVLKRIGIGIAVVVVGILLLAEFGVLKLQSANTTWSCDGKYETNTVNWRGMRLGSFGLVPTIVVSESGSGKAIAEEAARALRKVAAGQSASENVKFNINIERVTVSGAPWLPLYRNGSATFMLSYDLEAVAGASAIRVRGQVAGKVEQSMKGLSSLALFRENLGQAIASAAAADISKVIDKNGQ